MDEELTGHEAPSEQVQKLRKTPSRATGGDSGLAIESLPTAPYRGPLTIGDIEIQAFVLSDERRVLSGREITKAMALTGRGQGVARFVEAKYLEPFMGDSLREALLSPIHFVVTPGLPVATGYLAQTLPELCNAILDADEAGALRADQKTMARQAKILTRAFSTVGIVALVDEATGYQEVRDKKALHAILDKYIRWHDLAEWAKTFDDQFYEQLFRLRGWQYRPLVVAKPSYVGKLTNDLVYARLAPGVLPALRTIGERDDKGRLKRHHHRRLTDEVGRPALREHLASVVTLMKISSNWDRFMRHMNRVHPRVDQTLQLPYDPDEDDE